MELCMLSFVGVAVAAEVVNVIGYMCTEYCVSWLCGSKYLYTVLHIVHREYRFLYLRLMNHLYTNCIPNCEQSSGLESVEF